MYVDFFAYFQIFRSDGKLSHPDKQSERLKDWTFRFQEKKTKKTLFNNDK